MKKNIILTAALILLCLSVIYILSTGRTGSDSDDKLTALERKVDELTLYLSDSEEEIEALELSLSRSKTEIEKLTLSLSESEQVHEERKERIEQLTSGYPSGIWGCDSDVNRIVFKQEMKNATLNDIISKLNEPDESYDKPTLNFLRQDGDNVYIGVDDPEQLAERMGSAGANCFVGKVVYSITSIEGVNFVTLEFKEGSHAVPGKYSRADFEP